MATTSLDPAKVRDIAEARLSGASFKGIATKYGVGVGDVVEACKTYAKQQVIEGELALANPQGLFAGMSLSPFNPSELVSRRGLELFDRMRMDDQVKAAINYKKLAIISADWEVVSPPGQKPDWEPRGFVEYVFRNVGASFKSVMSEVLSALEYGYSVTEKVFKPIEKGEFKGKVGLFDMKTRRPHEIDFEQDEYGNLKDNGIQQRTYRGILKLPVSKFFIFTHQFEFSNFYGRSDLEAAYRPWWIKDNAYKWLAMLLERFGIPPIFALYNPNSMTPAQITSLVTAVKRLQASTAGALPRTSPDSLELWHPELAGQTDSVFIPALEMFNRDIARALLMPNLLGVTSDNREGSFARAQVQFDLFMLAVLDLRNQLCEAIGDQIIKQLVDVNYPNPDGQYPLFRFLPVTDDRQMDLMTRWTQMVQAQVVHLQDEDEEHIRRVFNFPHLGDNPRPFPDKAAGQQGNPGGNPNEPGSANPPKEPGAPKGGGTSETDNAEPQDVRSYGDKVSSLYINRRLQNPEPFMEWAQSAFKSTLPPEKLHVTVVYSREPVEWRAGGEAPKSVRIEGGRRSLERLGQNGEAVVLRFEAPELEARWKQYREAGASWDWDGYKPHMTITYQAPDLDLEAIEPYTGPLEFGPERFEPVDEGWRDKVREEAFSSGFDPNQPRDPKGSPTGGQWTDGSPGDAWEAPPDREWETIPADPEYLYHGTRASRAADISSSKLQTHRPNYGTDQDAWPDGSTEKRSYFTPSPKSARNFIPEDSGAPVLLRIKRTAAQFKAERGTGDWYASKPIPPKAIEVLGKGGNWVSVTQAFPPPEDNAELRTALRTFEEGAATLAPVSGAAPTHPVVRRIEVVAAAPGSRLVTAAFDVAQQYFASTGDTGPMETIAPQGAFPALCMFSADGVVVEVRPLVVDPETGRAVEVSLEPEAIAAAREASAQANYDNHSRLTLFVVVDRNGETGRLLLVEGWGADVIERANREVVGLLQVFSSGFDPNQPRDPKGSPTGGQWTDGSPGPQTYETVDGGTVTDHESAFKFSESLLKEEGFELESVSGQTRSIYMKRPGKSGVIRVADHANLHPGRNAWVVEARLSSGKETIIRRWKDELEGDIEEHDRITVIRESPEDIRRIIKAAVVDYDSRKEG